MQRIGIVGAGAWGTALAQVAATAGGAVTLWARDAALAHDIAARGENPRYLPGIALNPAITATAAAGDLAACGAVLLVTPAQALREMAARLRPHLKPGAPLVLCAKGVEIATGLLPHQVIAAVCPDHPLAVLSGPTFADEVAKGLPTAVTLAAVDPGLAEALAARLAIPTFRPYVSDDPVGAEIGGAVKNVLAIAAGIVMGRGLGENARAALITRGIAEMTRFGRRRGARTETLMGLAGVGDLILTCASTRSRNSSLGMALGQGRALSAILAERRGVTEGVATARALAALSLREDVEMPIAAAVDAILHRDADIDDTVRRLLARPLKSEGA